MRVYVPNKAGHDYSDAARYGELVFVTAGTQNKYSVNQMYRVWKEVLATSSPEDAILLTGLNIICSVGTAVFARKHGRVNILLWKNGKYIKRDIFLEEE